MNEASFEAELQKTFLEETLLTLDECKKILLQVEPSSHFLPEFEKLSRLFQPLKGSGVVVGFPHFTQFLTHIEMALLAVTKEKIPLNSAVINVILTIN